MTRFMIDTRLFWHAHVDVPAGLRYAVHLLLTLVLFGSAAMLITKYQVFELPHYVMFRKIWTENHAALFYALSGLVGLVSMQTRSWLLRLLSSAWIATAHLLTAALFFASMIPSLVNVAYSALAMLAYYLAYTYRHLPPIRG